jgi:hypothetical protein
MTLEKASTPSSGEAAMDSPNDKTPPFVSELPTVSPSMSSVGAEESMLPIRTDRLYQIAAVTAGIIFLATVI